MLRETELSQLNMDPITLIGKEWTLISAGDQESYNMMTASWGGTGVLWNKNITFMVLRPQRYTLEFVEKKDCYALNFFDESYRPALSYCGAHSGRDVNKEKESGLTPVFNEEAPYFAEAKLVLICRKLYKQTIDPECFIDKSLDGKNYPGKDYHECFVGEIIKVLKADED